MRAVGVICVGLGFVVLMSAIPIVLSAGEWVHLSLGPGCAAALGLPLLVVGILLTRHAAMRAGPAGEEAASAELLRKSTILYGFFGGDHRTMLVPYERKTAMDRLRAFDLNTLTASGWLLILASGMFPIGMTLLFLRLMFPDANEDAGPFVVLALFAGGLLAVAFFYVGRKLLANLGLPISEPVAPPRRSREPPSDY